MLTKLFEEYIDSNELKEMFQEADINGNGTIEREEWKAVLRKQRPIQGKSTWNKLKIFDKIGGQEIINKIVEAFYGKVENHEVLGNFFKGKDIEKIAKSQFVYIAQTVGSPTVWAGKQLDELHRGMNISPEVFDTYVELFVATAKE